jgi:hypothetical protein
MIMYMFAQCRLRRVVITLVSLALSWRLPKCDGFAANVPKSHQNEGVSKTLSRLVETSCLTFAILASTCTDASAVTRSSDEILATPSAETQHILSWQLPNGAVELSNPLTFGSVELSNPILLGAGGGGAVFATHPMNGVPNQDDIAVKISWVRSASSVERECKVLQELEVKHTRNVERCLGMETYPPDSERVMIALQPVVENAVSRVDKINPNVQPLAVQAIVRTLLDMLHANVVTTDVQTLMDKETGRVLFIDMTEAQTIAKPTTPSFLDLALASSFISEIIALIPSSLMDIASKTFCDELSAMHSRGEHLSLPIYELLREQEVLLNQKSAEIIDNIIASMQ